MSAVVLSYIFGGLLALDVAASWIVVRSNSVTPRQKALQLAFIWAVPLLGAATAWLVHKSTRTNLDSRITGDASTSTWMPGIGPESPGEHGGASGEGGP